MKDATLKLRTIQVFVLGLAALRLRVDVAAGVLLVTLYATACLLGRLITRPVDLARTTRNGVTSSR